MSADTIIQDPYDTQAYNRYSYVKNNPLKYTDPSGHFFSGVRDWISDNWKEIVTVVAVAIVVVVTGGAGAVGFAGLGWSPIAVGAAAGFTGGFVGTALNGGSFGQSLRNGVIGGIIGGVTAGFAKGIGDLGAWMGSQGYSAAAQLGTRAMLHGGLGAFMSNLRGGKWNSGFWGGSVGTLLSPLANTGNYYGNVASNAIIGGTVSSVTGGKFANGASFGAFRYMFNDALHDRWADRNIKENKFNFLTTVGGGLQVVTGGILVWSGVGAGAGVWMIGLGTNNIVAGFSGTNYLQKGINAGLDFIPSSDSATNEKIAAGMTLAIDISSGNVANAIRTPILVESVIFGKRWIQPTVAQRMGQTAAALSAGSNVNSYISTGEQILK